MTGDAKVLQDDHIHEIVNENSSEDEEGITFAPKEDDITSVSSRGSDVKVQSGETATETQKPWLETHEPVKDTMAEKIDENEEKQSRKSDDE